MGRGSWVGGSWVLSRGWWVVRPRSPYEINTSYIHSFYAVSNSRELSAIFKFSQHLKICGTYKKKKKRRRFASVVIQGVTLSLFVIIMVHNG